MPIVQLNGVNIHYEDTKIGKETIIFAHGLLWNCRMFDKQVEFLKKKYRCVTFDFRGHGKSELTKNGYDIETLYEDAVEFINKLGITQCHFVGLSMGGFIGMRLAARKPQLIKSLILIGTSADPEPKSNILKYKLLNFVARWFGISLVANKVMQIVFGQKFLNNPKHKKECNKWKKILVANDRIGITRAVNGIINRKGIRNEIASIKCPTLIMVGDQDVATKPEKSMLIQKRISGSELKIVDGVGHTATVEEPGGVNATILHFLKQKFKN